MKNKKKIITSDLVVSEAEVLSTTIITKGGVFFAPNSKTNDHRMLVCTTILLNFGLANGEREFF